MPWCPKCNNEYRVGMTVCADCGCELVEEEPRTSYVPVIFGDKEQMDALKQFLEYNKLENVVIKYDKVEEVYEILVQKEDARKAAAATKVFLQQVAERQKENGWADNAEHPEDHTSAEENKTTQPERNGAAYQKSSEKAEENRSSAWILLIVGVLGIVAVVLGITGILPLHLGNFYMFYGVMSAVFLLFLIMGIVSLKNAKIFAQKAESEHSLEDTLMKWCRENLNAEALDKEIQKSEEDTEETLYFRRYEKIKDKLNHQFMNLDQAFLEYFIDDKVYDMVFSDKL